MDLQFWIYIIAAIVWVLARALRNPAKGAQTTDEQQRESQSDDSGQRPITFEELLREIQEAKTPPKPIVAQEQPERSKPSSYQSAPPIKSYDVDYDDDIAEEEQDLETIPANRDNQASEVYERAKKEAFYRPSLEDTMKLSDTDLSFTHFKGYEEQTQKSMTTDILKDFTDPEGFKKAFIMSEILKRKF